MPLTRILVSLPLWFVLVAASPTPTPSTASTPSPTPSPTATPTPTPAPPPSPSPSPTQTPIPQNAFISLDVTSGDPNTVIGVTGGQFLQNEQITLWWDRQDHVAGAATADGNGSFNTRVKPFAGDPPGNHKLCASVLPNPCAYFTLNAPTTTPSPTAEPTEAPSPTTTASAVRLPITPTGTTINGLDVITRPPFVFLPLIGLAAIAVSLGYWVLTVVRRPRPVSMRSAAVVHRAMRPDYSAGFATQPAAPAASADPSPVPPAPGPTPTPPPAPPSPVWDTDPNAPAWGTGEAGEGYQFAPPPETPDSGEVPQPGD